MVTRLQSVIALPLQIDTSSVEAMERGMRLYNGKPMINSVSGKRESMEAVFPLVKKYGGEMCIRDRSSACRGAGARGKNTVRRAAAHGGWGGL